MEYGLDSLNKCLCLPGGRNPENWFFLAQTTVILRFINLQTHEEVLHVLPGQLRLLEGNWQQLFL